MTQEDPEDRAWRLWGWPRAYGSILIGLGLLSLLNDLLGHERGTLAYLSTAGWLTWGAATLAGGSRQRRRDRRGGTLR